MHQLGLTVADIRGVPRTEDDEEYDDVDDEFDASIPLGVYLTNELACDTIEARNKGPQASACSSGTNQTRLGDTKMTGETEMTAAQKAAADKLAAKKAALTSNADAAAAKKAEDKAVMEKAKAEQAARDAKIKADKEAQKAKEKAAKEAEVARLKAQKEKDAAKAKAEKDKAAAKAAAEKAAAKAKADKERAAKKAADEKAKAQARALREKEQAKRRAEREKAGLTGKTVPADLSRYSVNKEVKTAGGNASVDCNDATAERLRGMALDAVYKEAAKTLKENEADLRKRYAHLNPGMQRMNLGNRIRAAAAKGH